MPLIIQKLKLGNGRKVKHVSKSINLSSKMSSPVFFTLQLMGQSVQRESLLLHLLKALKYLVLSFFFFYFLIKDKILQTLPAEPFRRQREHTHPPRDCDSFLVKILWGQ